jgi:hypothetical protein
MAVIGKEFLIGYPHKRKGICKAIVDNSLPAMGINAP